MAEKKVEKGRKKLGEKAEALAQWAAARGWSVSGSVASRTPMPLFVWSPPGLDAALEEAWERAGLPRLSARWLALAADPAGDLGRALSGARVEMNLETVAQSPTRRDARGLVVQLEEFAEKAQVAADEAGQALGNGWSRSRAERAREALAPLVASGLAEWWQGGAAIKAGLGTMMEAVSLAGQRGYLSNEARHVGLWESGRPLAGPKLLAAMEEADAQWSKARPDLHFKARWGGVWEYLVREELGGADTLPWRGEAFEALRGWPAPARSVLAARERERCLGGACGPKPWAPPPGNGRYLHANSVSDSRELAREIEERGLEPAPWGSLGGEGRIDKERLARVGWESLSWAELTMARELNSKSYAVLGESEEHARGLARARGSKGARLSMEIRGGSPGGSKSGDESFAMGLAEELSALGARAGWRSLRGPTRAENLARMSADLLGGAAPCAGRSALRRRSA